MTTRLGLGAAPLGNLFHPVTDETAEATVDAAWDAGIRYFDTAPLYGHGLSEVRLGRALRNRPRREFHISTKVGRLLVPGDDPDSIFVDVPPVRPVFDFSFDGVMRSFEASLERLGLDRVDTVLVHDPEGDRELAARDGAFPALFRLRDEGVITRVGAGMNVCAPLVRFVSDLPLDCILVAGRWTLLDRSAGRELLPLCAEKGVDVVAGGVFNSGLLARPSAHATYDYQSAPDVLLRAALEMQAHCEEAGATLPAAAINFAARHPAVSTVIVGMRSPEEVGRNLAAAGTDVPENLWAELDRVLADAAP